MWDVGEHLSSTSFEGFQLLQCPRPVRAEQARETSVSKNFSARLTASAVVGFVIGITNALDLLAASRTGLVEAAMHGHLGTKSSDLLGEFFPGFG